MTPDDELSAQLREHATRHRASPALQAAVRTVFRSLEHVCMLPCEKFKVCMAMDVLYIPINTKVLHIM
jgi:hypothetical protein